MPHFYFQMGQASPYNLFFQVIDVFVNCFVWCNYCLLDHIAIVLLNPQIAAGYTVQSYYEDHEAWLQGGKVTVTKHKMSRIHNYNLNSVHSGFLSNWKKISINTLRMISTPNACFYYICSMTTYFIITLQQSTWRFLNVSTHRSESNTFCK